MIEWAVGSAYGTMVLKMVVLTCHFVVCLSKMNDNLDCYSVSAAVDCAEMQFYECISLH